MCVGFTVRGSWRSNITAIFWPQSYGRQRCVFLVLQGCSTGGPGLTLLGDGFPYCILSATSLVPKLHRGSRGPLRPGVAFSTTTRLCPSPTLLELQLAATPLPRRTQLSYIIVRRPLDLWNRMFNRHQAEITVMQFRGHSLPVHQSMSVPWEFVSPSHFISQFPPTRFPLITAIRMCHLLPVASPWNVIFGRVKRSKYNTGNYRPRHYNTLLENNCLEHETVDNELLNHQNILTQLAGAAEYTDCISAVRKGSLNECPV